MFNNGITLPHLASDKSVAPIHPTPPSQAQARRAHLTPAEYKLATGRNVKAISKEQLTIKRAVKKAKEKEKRKKKWEVAQLEKKLKEAKAAL